MRTARANPRNRTYSKSLRGLAHDDVLQLSLLHHKVDELDLRHLSAPRAGATVGSQCPSSAKTNPAQCPHTPTHARCRRPSQCTHPGSKANCVPTLSADLSSHFFLCWRKVLKTPSPACPGETEEDAAEPCTGRKS